MAVEGKNSIRREEGESTQGEQSRQNHMATGSLIRSSKRNDLREECGHREEETDKTEKKEKSVTKWKKPEGNQNLTRALINNSHY